MIATEVRELKGFDDQVRKLMRDWKVNGVAVGVVREGEIVHLADYGRRNVDEGLEVTPHTLMPIGSTTKTFTTTAVSLLVDDGIVQADDLVVDFHRIGDQDRVFVDPQHALRQAGLTVAGRAVDED